MQLEIKVLLGGVRDYHAVVNALNPLFLSEDSYEDYFFDFPTGSLTDENSLLRLRVPCLKPESVSSPVMARTSADAWLRNESSQHHHPHAEKPTLSQQGGRAVAGEAADAAGGEASSFGRLIFKRNNTVEAGHQLAFTTEDQHVPADIVSRLIGGREKPFDVLLDYAARVKKRVEAVRDEEAGANGVAAKTPTRDSREPAIVSIIDRLRDAAVRLREADPEAEEEQRQQGGRASSQQAVSASQTSELSNLSAEAEEANMHYGRVRYAAGMSPGPGSRGDRAKQHRHCDLVTVGSYKTTRKTFAYLRERPSSTRVAEGAGAATAASSAPKEDQAWRSRLTIRVDKTLYPFGEKYELEVPRIGSDSGLSDDIMDELTMFLGGLRVDFQRGSSGKYVRFVQGMRSLRAEAQAVSDVKLRITNINGYNEIRRHVHLFLDSDEHSGGALSAQARQGLKRLRPNAEVDAEDIDDGTGGGEQDLFAGPVAGGGGGASSLATMEERHENYFFDSPTNDLAERRCFLRLRHYVLDRKYMLVLKEDNAFVQGTHWNRSRKTVLSDDVAQSLIDNPAAWLDAQHEHNAIAHELRSGFGLVTLQRTALFTTRRINIPWWTARSQHPTTTSERLSATGTATSQLSHATAGTGGERGSTQPHAQALSMSQVQQHVQPWRTSTAAPSAASQARWSSAVGPNAVSEPAAVVPPLIIHLDRSQYRVTIDPARQQAQRVPFSQAASTGYNIISDPSGATHPVAFFELYELEVSNIVAAQPHVVKEEMVQVLQRLRVEWETGVQSKLDQYHAFAARVLGS